MGDLLHYLTYPQLIKLGTLGVSKIMLGEEKVWPRIEPCGSPIPYDGGLSFPTSKTIYLGPTTGTVTLSFDALSVPDRFIVIYDGVIKIDTGYRGLPSFSYGGSDRDRFNDGLNGKVDIVTGLTYPFSNPAHAPDGYPYVPNLGSGTASFSKTTSSTEAEVRVYAPIYGTEWDFTLMCPVGGDFILD